MRSPVAGSLALVLSAVLLATAAPGAAQPPRKGPEAWSGCCGLTPWPPAGPMTERGSHAGAMFSGYGSIAMGSVVRHNLALKGKIPAPFATMHNPLPATPQNARRGQAIYEAQCAACHGESGLADGPESHNLTPTPAELGWITRLPMKRWDPFMYWSIAENGKRFGTDMPEFKGKLSSEEIWSVVGYIQARLPKPAGAAPPH